MPELIAIVGGLFLLFYLPKSRCRLRSA